MGVSWGLGDKRMDLFSGKESNVSWSLIEYGRGRREKSQGFYQVTFLDKPANNITTKREKEDRVLQ